MSRSEAYHGALRYFFQNAIVRGTDRRIAWRAARNLAATYIFHISTHDLTEVTL